MNERDKERIASIRRSINEGDCPPYCIGPITDLFKIIDRLDKQPNKMLALLERWVAITEVDESEMDETATKEFLSVVNDTKTLLKEAKEVK